MVYLDTSIVAPLLLPEATSDEVERYLQNFSAGELRRALGPKRVRLISRKRKMSELDKRQLMKWGRATIACCRISSTVTEQRTTSSRRASQDRKTGCAGDRLHLLWPTTRVLTTSFRSMRA